MVKTIAETIDAATIIGGQGSLFGLEDTLLFTGDLPYVAVIEKMLVAAWKSTSFADALETLPSPTAGLFSLSDEDMRISAVEGHDESRQASRHG